MNQDVIKLRKKSTKQQIMLDQTWQDAKVAAHGKVMIAHQEVCVGARLLQCIQELNHLQVQLN